MIQISLSEKSIRSAIQELKRYQSDLQKKTELYVQRLAGIGEQVAIQAINESPMGEGVSLRREKTPEEMGCKVVLIATGKTFRTEGRAPFYSVLAIEFGSGIHYNPTPNPKANEFGLGVGTYPGQVHAFEDGWYYLGADDKWHYTHGVKATMPLFKASQEILRQYVSIAKEVFGGGGNV